MIRLFEPGELRLLLSKVLKDVADRIENLPEDELLTRSTDDLVEEFALDAILDVPTIADDPVDGAVKETSMTVQDRFFGGQQTICGFAISATFEYTGDQRLFQYRPMTYLMTTLEADLRDGKITVKSDQTGNDISPEQAQDALKRKIDPIRTQLSHVATDVTRHNGQVATELRQIIEQRKDRLQKRRNLAGALGFPLAKRQDAPLPVPITRKRIGSSRMPKAHTPYEDEPALTTAQYEDAIKVVRSTLLAMERTPSVASGNAEEDLRDQILVQLNGAFEGGATGETFVQNGKTDILVNAGERHVFVGECKWWSGPKACGEAIDQLLSYLPWRDEKGALILFIGRKDATAVIEKADEAVRAHAAFKRVGPASDDLAGRRNFVLGHPDDRDREIRLAVLFAVLPRDA